MMPGYWKPSASDFEMADIGLANLQNGGRFGVLLHFRIMRSNVVVMRRHAV